MVRKKMHWLDILAITLLIIGGLNWGLVGFFKFDLVKYLLGNMTFLTRLVYGLVGISAVYSIYSLGKLLIKK